MVKMFALIPARADRSLEHFHEHWRTRHRELALGLESMRRYVQCHRLALELPAPPEDPIEGIALVWFDSVDAALGMIDDPVFVADIAPDEQNFMDVETRRFLFTADDEAPVGGEIPKGPDAVKATLLFRRDSSRGASDFASWWRDDQRRLLERSFPGARRATGSLALAEANDPDLGIDAIAELWWDSAADLRAGWSEAWEAYRAGSEGFLDAAGSSIFFSSDLWVIES
jgi:uncharacterized protein (TIGR02118 family)